LHDGTVCARIFGMKKLIHSLSKHFKKIQAPAPESPPKPEIKIPKTPHTEKKPQKVELEIPTKTVVKTLLVIVLFLAGMEVVVQLKNLIIIIFISGLLTLGITPLLNKLEARRIPRPLGIAILYVVFLGLLAILFIQIIPILAEQLLGIAHDLKNHVLAQNFSLNLGGIELINWETDELQALLADNLMAFSKNLQNVAGSTLDIVSSIFQGVFNLIFTLTLLFFMLLERERIGVSLLKLFPVKNQAYVLQKTHSVQVKMAEWFRGQFILMLIVGLWVYVGMTILGWTVGIEYAATIAILAAFAELLPYVGPFLTYVMVGLIASNVSTTAVIFGLAFVGLTQFLEGNFLVPVVMKKAVGLSSVMVILALAIGGALGYASGGVATAIVGMIFAIPVAASVAMIISEEQTSRAARKKEKTSTEITE
jgi:predicted PurR-regulated permease PerM